MKIYAIKNTTLAIYINNLENKIELAQKNLELTY